MSEVARPGDVLVGKYRVERVLGRGGMGTVLEATQLGLERRVAVKFLLAESSDDAMVALLRFEREARAAARLRGDHVVQVFDFGRLEHGEPFIVMELLDGQDLRTTLAVKERLPVRDAVTYVLQACEALAEAHVAGVVHRDLKPANLFITRRPDGRHLLKVLDFGISKLTSGEEDLGLTSTRGAIGSPLYMSPEQLQSSKSVDHRTDVWSLGTVLFELITGVAPFYASSLAEVHARILALQPPDLVSLLPDAPEGLSSVILRCLCKAPDDRWATMADFALALAPYAAPSALGSVTATVEIIRGSALDHGDLPSPSPSMVPSAPVMFLEPSVRPSVVLTARDGIVHDRTEVAQQAELRSQGAAAPPRAPLRPLVASGHESTLAASSWMNDSDGHAESRRWPRRAGLGAALLAFSALVAFGAVQARGWAIASLSRDAATASAAPSSAAFLTVPSARSTGVGPVIEPASQPEVAPPPSASTTPRVQSRPRAAPSPDNEFLRRRK